MKPSPVVEWVTTDDVASNPPTLHVAALKCKPCSTFIGVHHLSHSIFPSFNFNMCLADEVVRDSLRCNLHGQVRPSFIFVSTIHSLNEDFSALKFGLRRKSIRSGNFCILDPSWFTPPCVLHFSIVMSALNVVTFILFACIQ